MNEVDARSLVGMDGRSLRRGAQHRLLDMDGNAVKTHCIRGHKLEWARGEGKRRCKVCKEDQRKARLALTKVSP